MTYYGHRRMDVGIGCAGCNWTGVQEAADERRHYSWPCECLNKKRSEPYAAERDGSK